MPKKKINEKKTLINQLTDLSWNDLVEWAGHKIVTRGKNYQNQGRVSALAIAGGSSLVATVEGTRSYITKVSIHRDELPESVCTCPYCLDCKHGVAVIFEFLKQIDEKKKIPTIKKNDNRLALLENDEWDDEVNEKEKEDLEIIRQDIDKFLKRKTKSQLIDLIHEFAETYPGIGYDLSNRQQIKSGSTEVLVARLREEIRIAGGEPGWQNYWDGEGYTPDYSGIRKNLRILLDTGHLDEVVDLGRDLVDTGIRQVEESHDEGETGLEVASCMPIIAEALGRSSLGAVDKLNWALDAVLKDPFNLCDDFAEYLGQNQPKVVWNEFANRLLDRLKKERNSRSKDEYSRKFDRDRFSFWTIHALERAGRKKEIIPLCITEVEITGNYERLVDLFIQEKDFQEAEKWIKKGVRDVGKKWPGVKSSLHKKLREIRKQQKRWPEVAAIQVEEFIDYPAEQSFKDCRKTCNKTGSWTTVRKALLDYLEQGKMPWTRKNWPLPESGLVRPVANPNHHFPMIGHLITIAILEQKPDQVLKWYDRKSKDRFGWYGPDEDTIAMAVAKHAPDRAVKIWKDMAERLIAKVKPSAYQKASKYLIKAEKVLRREKNTAEWGKYIDALRKQHFRKTRLIEILDDLNGKPILQKQS